MAEPGPDTTFRRAGHGPGFDGRVEPLWFAYREFHSKLGFFARWGERSKVKAVIKGVNGGILSQKGNPDGWERGEGGRACNLKVAKMGLVRELKTWLKNATEGAAEKRWPHLHVLRDRPCLLIPVVFPKPLSVSPGGKEEPLPVASAVKVREELAELSRDFRIEETFAIKKMVDFLDAKEKEIEAFESRSGQQEGFWPKFSYVLLRKLVDVSLEKKQPAFLA